MLLDTFNKILASEDSPNFAEVDEHIRDTIYDKYDILIESNPNEKLSICIENNRAFYDTQKQSIEIIKDYIYNLCLAIKGEAPKVNEIRILSKETGMVPRAVCLLIIALAPCLADDFKGIEFYE